MGSLVCCIVWQQLALTWKMIPFRDNTHPRKSLSFFLLGSRRTPFKASQRFLIFTSLSGNFPNEGERNIQESGEITSLTWRSCGWAIWSPGQEQRWETLWHGVHSRHKAVTMHPWPPSNWPHPWLKLVSNHYRLCMMQQLNICSLFCNIELLLWWSTGWLDATGSGNFYEETHGLPI